MPPRQARLRAQFSDWYTRITPGEWHHALWVRERVLANLRKGKPQWHEREEDGGRVLCDAHFDFQGGWDDAKGRRGVERRMVQRAS
jgi:hypothetical protein